MNGRCHLCNTETDLCLSHIIPKFVYHWLIETSPGYIRDSREPNRRVQDGVKEYLLCSKCEELFSNWEKQFAENIFMPIHTGKNRQLQMPYEEWCMKFAVSVSWRVLTYGKIKGINHFTNEQNAKADEALVTWGSFLLGKRNHPGEFEQHIIPLDIVDNHTVERMSPYINRYFLRSVDVDIASSTNRAFIYAKMVKVLLIGLIDESHPKHWKGTKLHVRKGVIGSKRYVAPGGLETYISSRADKAAKSLASLSPKQRKKVEDMLSEKINKLGESEVFHAMMQDVKLFGSNAFEITKGSKQK
jgi:hypothetical protein